MTSQSSDLFDLDSREDSIVCEKEGFLHPAKDIPARRRWSRARIISYCGLVAVLWSTSTIIAFQAGIQHHRSARSYETGFDTDLKPIWGAIELQKVRFTGGLKFDENGTTYRVVEGTQYVGEPSPAIDRAWVALLEMEAVDLIGEEAESLVGKTYQKPSGHYLTGMDVFHQLHCLNEVRKALRPEYYTPENPEPIHTYHIEHCIDTLRQTLQCSADATAITVGWSDVRRRILQDFDELHTCRNFVKLQAWQMERNAQAHPLGHPL